MKYQYFGMEETMRKNRTVKRLEHQNDMLRKRNTELRKQIPTRNYTKKIENALDQFENINDELLQLYKKLHKDRIQRKKTYWKYKLGILKIHIKQKLKL